MKLEDLQKIFENATEEQLQQIKKFFDDTKDKELIVKLQEENNNLSTQVTEFKEKITKLEKNKDNAEQLSKDLESLKLEMQEKEVQYKKEKEERQINDVINEIFVDKKFVNEITKQGYAVKLKDAILDEKNKGKSAKELFDDMIKDVDNIFINDQQEKVEIPAVGDIGSTFFTSKQLEKMSIDEINANWDNIKKGVAN